MKKITKEAYRKSVKYGSTKLKKNNIVEIDKKEYKVFFKDDIVKLIPKDEV